MSDSPAIVDHFLQKLEQVDVINDLNSLISLITHDLGFTYFALIQHVHPLGWPYPIIHHHN